MDDNELKLGVAKDKTTFQHLIWVPTDCERYVFKLLGINYLEAALIIC